MLGITESASWARIAFITLNTHGIAEVSSRARKASILRLLALLRLVEALTAGRGLDRHSVAVVTCGADPGHAIILDAVLAGLARAASLHLLSAFFGIVITVRASDWELSTSWAVVTLGAYLGGILGRNGTKVTEVASIAKASLDTVLAVFAFRAERAVLFADHSHEGRVTEAAIWAQRGLDATLRAVSSLALCRCFGARRWAVVASWAVLACVRA